MKYFLILLLHPTSQKRSHRQKEHEERKEHEEHQLDNTTDVTKYDGKVEGIADPCTEASLFWGDQALSEEDVARIFGRSTDEVQKDLLQATDHKINRNVTEGQDALRTDIKNRDRRRKRAVTSLPERKWPEAVIPYQISDNFTATQRSIFHQAMRHWELHTCVTFIERTDEEAYIFFTKRPCGCCSFVGRRGSGPQAISIGKNCDKFGIVVHELGHVVGFWHEHTRPDRDGYIEVIYQNIQDNQDYNFQKMPRDEINSLGEEYDFGSIMHYSRNTFSKGAFLDTILPRPDSYTKVRPIIGQRTRLSKGDIVQARKLYTCPTCGQTLQTPEGNASSPGYPGPVPNRQYHCVWRISATPGEKIAINITHLGFTYPDRDCQWDYMEIRDGPSRMAPLLGRWCHENYSAKKMISSTHRVWILFRSLSRQTHTGFHLEYRAICGGNIDLKQNDKYEIMSPNFPEEYPSNSNCSWVVSVPPGHQIAFHFDQFEIERHDTCQYDFLEIRDGSNSSSPLLSRFCGYETPDAIRSTGDKLFIHFQTDSSVAKPGFMARILPERDECKVNNGGCEQKCINELGGFKCDCHPGFKLHRDGQRCESTCGGTLSSARGNISSPGFPSNYPPSKSCLWMIVAPSEYKITFTFNEFHIEGADQCQYDFLEVRSGLTGDSSLLGTFCGTNLPTSITSKKNHLRLLFKSDESVTKKGFHATWAFDLDECNIKNGGCQHKCINTPGSYHCGCNEGYVLHINKKDCKEEKQCGSTLMAKEQAMTLQSPGFDDGRYPSRANCIWKLQAKPGHRIRLRWQNFQLENHPECGYDRVEISENQILRRKLCSMTPPPDYTSEGQNMDLRFFSDTSVTRKGFKVTYQSECGGNLTGLSRSKMQPY